MTSNAGKYLRYQFGTIEKYSKILVSQIVTSKRENRALVSQNVIPLRSQFAISS